MGWGTNLDDYFVAIAAGCLQKTGGSFSLSAETDFGASYGLKSLYYKSRSANVAATGTVRLANSSDSVSFRNAANSADIALKVTNQDHLNFNGEDLQFASLTLNHIRVGQADGTSGDVAMSGDVAIVASGATTIQPGVVTGSKIASDTITNTNINSAAAIAYSKLSLADSIVNADINASAAIALSKLATVTASRAVQSSSGGLLEASSVTTTELGYVSGVTSAIQTQLNLKAPIASPTFTGVATSPVFSSTNYMDFLGVSNPAAPAAGTARFHAATANGFTRFEQDNEAATNLVLGRDTVFIAKNTSGSLIAKGKPVYCSGSTGNVPNIALAKADSLTTLPLVAVALDDIGINAFGQVMVGGILSGIDTSAWSTGDQIWVSAATAGALTNVRPVSPNYAARVATVLVSGVGNGSLLIVTAPFIGGIESGTTSNYKFGGTITTSLTANRALSTGAAGILAVSATTDTELGYLSGVSSSVQTQLNGKLSTGGGTLTGDLTFSNQKGIILQDTAGSPKSATITAPTTLTNTYAWRLPLAQGASNQYLTNDGSGNLFWSNAAGSGTVNTGTQYQLGYYATGSNVISGLTLITASRALASDANGLPVASATTATELGYVSGVTSAIQTQFGGKANTALSNLASVAINAGLLPGSDLAIDLGGTSFKWSTIYGRTVNCGVSGTGGSVNVYPTTASKGRIRLIANDNSGDYLVSLINAVHSRSAQYTIPDVGADADFLMTQGNQTKAGTLTLSSALVQTTSAAADMKQLIFVNNATGDPCINFVTNATDWTQGVDNSDSDAYKIAASNALGTTDLFILGTAGWGSVGPNPVYAAGYFTLATTGAENAYLRSLVNNATGDPALQLSTNAADWTIGADNSDGDKLKIGPNAAVGTSSAVIIDATSGAVAIKGSSTNDSAAAGFVGEVIEATVTSPVDFPTSTQNGDLTSISLTAGDWLVTGCLIGLTQSTTVNYFAVGISTTSGNTATTAGVNDFIIKSSSESGVDTSVFCPNYHLQLSGTTTVYLKYRAGYGAGTAPKAYGRITAVRIR